MLAFHKDMKTNMKKIKQVIFLAVAALTVWGCSQKNSTPATTYTMLNGQCYNNNNQIVDQSYCAGVFGTGAYTLNANGMCYQTSTGQQVPITYCQNQNTGFSYVNGRCVQTATGQEYPVTYCSQTTGLQCNGVYYYQGQMGYQMVQCTGMNCRGYTLLDQQGRTVTCQ